MVAASPLSPRPSQRLAYRDDDGVRHSEGRKRLKEKIVTLYDSRKMYEIADDIGISEKHLRELLRGKGGNLEIETACRIWLVFQIPPMAWALAPGPEADEILRQEAEAILNPNL